MLNAVIDWSLHNRLLVIAATLVLCGFVVVLGRDVAGGLREPRCGKALP